MCGLKLSRFLSALVLLSLLPLPLSADYTITEEELTALESILTRQEATIETLQSKLKLSESIQNQLLSTLNQSETTIEKLKQSLTAYEREVRTKTVRTTIVSAGAGIITGYVIGRVLSW